MARFLTRSGSGPGWVTEPGSSTYRRCGLQTTVLLGSKPEWRDGYNNWTEHKAHL